MRWRFVDRIDSFVAWQTIAGCKSISLEEYSLLEPMGREGVFPASLVLECCVGLGRWLAVRSSEFQQTSVLREIDDFGFQRELGPGETVRTTLTVHRQSADEVEAWCEVAASDRIVATGTIALELLQLGGRVDIDFLRGMWRKLYETSRDS